MRLRRRMPLTKIGQVFLGPCNARAVRLVRPFRSGYDRNQGLGISDIPDGLDPFNYEPVDTLGVRLQKLSGNLYDCQDIVPAGNDVNLLHLGELEQSVSDLRLLAQDRGHIDEGANMPFHLTVRMIMSGYQVIDVLGAGLEGTPYNSLDKSET